MPVDSARRVDRLFTRYGESHRHPADKAIHWVGGRVDRPVHRAPDRGGRSRRSSTT